MLEGRGEEEEGVEREYEAIPEREEVIGTMRNEAYAIVSGERREDMIGTMRNEAYAIVGGDKGGMEEGTLQTEV